MSVIAIGYIASNRKTRKTPRSKPSTNPKKPSALWIMPPPLRVLEKSAVIIEIAILITRIAIRKHIILYANAIKLSVATSMKPLVNELNRSCMNTGNSLTIPVGERANTSAR